MIPNISKLEETAELLVRAGASSSVIIEELVKLGADETTAKRIGMGMSRHYKIKKVAPYFAAIAIIIVLTFILAGWQWALAIGLLSTYGVRELFLADKRPKDYLFLTKKGPLK